MKIHGDHSFSTFVKFSGKLTFLPLIRTRTYAYEGVRNINFSENFANALNEWSHVPCGGVFRPCQASVRELFAKIAAKSFIQDVWQGTTLTCPATKDVFKSVTGKTYLSKISNNNTRDHISSLKFHTSSQN